MELEEINNYDDWCGMNELLLMRIKCANTCNTTLSNQVVSRSL